MQELYLQNFIGKRNKAVTDISQINDFTIQLHSDVYSSLTIVFSNIYQII